MLAATKVALVPGGPRQKEPADSQAFCDYPTRRWWRPIVTGSARSPVPSSAMRSWLIRGVVASGAVGMASAVYQAAAEARDRRRFPPPGRLANVGGRFLHLLEAGTGSPAVVIVPAIGGNVLDSLAFQRELARDMRVCVYDRAGFGWSDPPPRGRRTFNDMADELRQGLAGAGIGPPYVLVGHSIGGIIARRFTVRHRHDVAGLVLIDSSHEDQTLRRRAEGWWRGAPRMFWYALRRRVQVLGLRRLAVQAGFSELNAEIARDVPPAFAAAARAINLTARHRRTVTHEIMLIARSHGQPPELGDLPLTVLTAAARDDTWMQMQAELAKLSTASRHIVAAHGGHYLQRDEPELVASAIRDLISRIRKPATSLPCTDALSGGRPGTPSGDRVSSQLPKWWLRTPPIH